MRVIILILYFISIYGCGREEKVIAEDHSSKRMNSKQAKNEIHLYTRMNEPKENAFSMLVPQNWIAEGGIFRVDPTMQGGASQSIAAKLDFTIKNNNQGDIMIRWLPDVLYFDARNSPAGQMGLFPQGSNYQGMTVLNIMKAKDFITQIAFNYAHPNAKNLKIVEVKKLEDVASNYTKRVKQAIPYSTMSYDASLVKFNYSENNKEFEEIVVSIIENWGQLGAGMWGNKETFLIRAPRGELEKWKKTFSVIQNSVKLNLNWVIGEIKGQQIRGEIAANTQKEIERIGREITAHRQKTNSEIQNDMYLTLMEKEEYVNPYTKEIEVGTNQWKHRWINESGDVIYTDSEDYDPNTDINLNRSDFKRSEIRKRFPQ